MTSVQELGDDGGAAHGPGPAPVDLDQGGRHHVVVLQLPEDLLARLHVVVGHVEDVSWGGRGHEVKQDSEAMLILASGETARV